MIESVVAQSLRPRVARARVLARFLRFELLEEAGINWPRIDELRVRQ